MIDNTLQQQTTPLVHARRFYQPREYAFRMKY